MPAVLEPGTPAGASSGQLSLVHLPVNTFACSGLEVGQAAMPHGTWTAAAGLQSHRRRRRAGHVTARGAVERAEMLIAELNEAFLILPTGRAQRGRRIRWWRWSSPKSP